MEGNYPTSGVLGKLNGIKHRRSMDILFPRLEDPSDVCVNQNMQIWPFDILRRKIGCL